MCPEIFWNEVLFNQAVTDVSVFNQAVTNVSLLVFSLIFPAEADISDVTG